MQWQLPIHIKKPDRQLNYGQRVLLIGSCFTEHMGQGLADIKFDVLQNPHGILFSPDAVCNALEACITNRSYSKEDLFFDQELWHSWDHHSRFSDRDQTTCLHAIQHSQEEARRFIQQTDCLIITLGSAFSYRLTDQALRASYAAGYGVANCHRAPQQWFSKELMPVAAIVERLKRCLASFRALRPEATVMITVSPVRHARDGVVENNRSKARLFEALQQLEEQGESFYYFPAYELVVDVLRDYRFYDIDLVHPNYAATEFVLEQFMEHCITPEAVKLSVQLKRLVLAYRHRPRQAGTNAHHRFLQQQLQTALSLQQQYPVIDLQQEIAYFSQAVQ